MKFKKSLFGFNKKQVKQFVEKNDADQKAMQAQRERIAELVEQNERLTKQVEKYQEDEQAVSRALITSQELADKLKNDAEKYSDIVLTRAKIFYAAWQAYTQTLVASLSDSEVQQLNSVIVKIEKLINAYEGKNVAEQSADLSRKAADEQTSSNEAKTADTSAKSADEKQVPSHNPIKRMEQVSGHAIDLRELVAPTQSLADICRDLGLTATQGELKLDLDATKGED